MTAAGLSSMAMARIRREGLRSVASQAVQVARARWQLRRASSVAPTVRLRGSALVLNNGTMAFGERVRLDGTTVRLEFVTGDEGRLEIGEGTYINYGSNFSALGSVTIGMNCLFGQYAIVMDSDYHDVEDHYAPGKTAPITIEDNVWIGARVTVLRGAHIGEGAVIGAHSVVTHDIPPRCFAAGVPARVVRMLDEHPAGDGPVRR